MDCGPIVVLLGVRDASRRAFGIACIVVRTSCSLPSWSASSTLLKWLLTRELGRRCDFHIYLHRALP